MAGFLRAFNASLVRRPMLTQCATYAVLFGAGDVLAQQAFEKKGKDHDFVRTARLTFYGGGIFGPLVATWLGALNRAQFSSPLKGVIYRVWLDQAVFSPIMVGVFFSSMSFLEGKGIPGAKERINESYVSTLVRNWAVFVPAQAVNFALVPAHMRFAVVGTVSLFWNAYLSAVNAYSAQHVEVAAVSEKKDE
ncbi:hypothetical protein B0H21DRAFT_789916 [Amylocystis lapponica]|nr:hypothetical protein B0H21DRAFT_789916 [Amylocystis lapponica]